MVHKMIGVLTCVFVSLVAAGTAWADGAVYAMTNALGNNQINVYHRAGNGTLTLMQTIATGGGGSGLQLDGTDSLGSQGSLVLDKKHHRLLAVNTESLAEHTVGGSMVGDCQQGTISSFRVAPDGSLLLVDRVLSGGLFPDSLAVDGNLLYVLNAGGPGLNPVCSTSPNITGFKLRPGGEISLLTNATQPINPASSTGTFPTCDPGGFPAGYFDCGMNPPAFRSSPGQVGFTPDDKQLVVTVKATNTIYVFPIERGGIPGTPTVTQAQGPNQPTYFGFAFDREGHLIVSEPFGASPTIPASPASTVSSFAITRSGDLEVISASIPNGQGTSCWVVLEPQRERYAYIADNATSDISSYTVGDDGSLTLLAGSAAVANRPNDMAVAREGNSDFLYVLGSGDGTVDAFQINGDGSLTSLGVAGGLPIGHGAQGLAAY